MVRYGHISLPQSVFLPEMENISVLFSNYLQQSAIVIDSRVEVTVTMAKGLGLQCPF